MNIGLVDIDGHAKKKKWGATIYPNIALAKISRYHKRQGDNVEWAFAMKHYDSIYMSKIFNFSPDDLTAYDADEIIKGGTGYDIHSHLPVEIDRLQPDYSLYPNVPSDMAYGFLTRGCPNKCAWCVVPRKEGAIVPYMDVDDIAIEGRNKLVLMDNNILAAGDYAKQQLQKIIDKKYKVDFNQALDARLVTDEFAQLLAQVKWLDKNRIRFGCDTPKQIEECERAMEMITGYGFKGEYFLYTSLQKISERVIPECIIGGISCRKRGRATWVIGYMLMHSPTETLTIHTGPFHNGKRIWQAGLTRKPTLWHTLLKSLNQEKDLNV